MRFDENENIKGTWRKEEDDLLKKVVEEHGPKNWSFISKFISGRNPKQCRTRWKDHLSPDINVTCF